MKSLRAAALLALLLAALISACAEPGASPSSSSAEASATVAPPASATAVPSASEAPEVEARTLRTLIEAEPETPTLTVEREEPGGDGYSTAVVSYESGGLTIYGVLHTPDGEGPLPGIVFIHGAVDPATWSGLDQYVEEQERMASAGYVVFVPDLRNHGDSDIDPAFDFDLEMGTSLDAINAARALAAEASVDPARIAVVGHSLGGVITLNTMVAAPDVAAAFVTLASSSASVWENIQTFVGEGTPFYNDLVELRGTPDDNPEFWADVSSRTFVDRVTRPLLVVHGTADNVVPPPFADAIATAWTDAGKDVELVIIEGGDHIFAPHEDEAWAAVFTFLDERLTR